MSTMPSPRRLLLVGGAGGLVGRALLREFGKDWSIRSVHPHLAPGEAAAKVEWVPQSVSGIQDWAPLLGGVDLVLNVAWLRTGSARRFRPLRDGLLRLIKAAERAGIARFVHISVPDAPSELEHHLPYLSYKRDVDQAVRASSLPFLIPRPTMLFGERDRLLTVMMRVMHRYGRFPMFGDGEYHVSPLASDDLASIIRAEVERPGSRSLLLGGPTRYRYRELTDHMWSALGKDPRYWSISPRSSVRLARLMERLGSRLIYAYEVEWLLSDMLGLPAYTGLDRPLRPVEPFLQSEAERLRSGARVG